MAVTSKSPVVRLKPATYRYLQRRSKAEGKPIGRLIDEAVRPRKGVDPLAVLEQIQDLLDARELTAAIEYPNHKWISLEQLDQDLGLSWPADRPKRRK